MNAIVGLSTSATGNTVIRVAFASHLLKYQTLDSYLFETCKSLIGFEIQVFHNPFSLHPYLCKNENDLDKLMYLIGFGLELDILRMNHCLLLHFPDLLYKTLGTTR